MRVSHAMASAPDDLTGLRVLDEATVLACLGSRYAALQPYIC